MRNVLSLFTILILTTQTAFARPKNIVPNQLYHSDSYTMELNIAEIGEDKNIEEVFKNYYYYTIIYDKKLRVINFKIYERGSLKLEEIYTYKKANQGYKVQKMPKKTDKTIKVPSEQKK